MDRSAAAEPRRWLRALLGVVVLVAIALLQSLPQPVASQALPLGPSMSPGVKVSGPPEARARLDSALTTMAELGLRLPDLSVTFWDTEQPCRGPAAAPDRHYLGRYEGSPQLVTIDVCSDLSFVLPHELGHAWAVGALGKAARQAFVEEEGLIAWADPSLPRDAQGTERVAYVLSRVIRADGPTGDPAVDASFDRLLTLAH